MFWKAEVEMFGNAEVGMFGKAEVGMRKVELMYSVDFKKRPINKKTEHSDLYK